MTKPLQHDTVDGTKWSMYPPQTQIKLFYISLNEAGLIDIMVYKYGNEGVKNCHSET